MQGENLRRWVGWWIHGFTCIFLLNIKKFDILKQKKIIAMNMFMMDGAQYANYNMLASMAITMLTSLLVIFSSSPAEVAALQWVFTIANWMLVMCHDGASVNTYEKIFKHSTVLMSIAGTAIQLRVLFSLVQ